MPKMFSSPQQQQIYDLYLRTPPTLSSGTGLIAAYWRGRNDDGKVLQHPPYVRDSLAYAAWRAGKKARAIAIYYPNLSRPSTE
jgi:hypothetical protein